MRRPLESEQYASDDYRELLKQQGITCSMSRKEWPKTLRPRVPPILFAPWRLGVKWALNFPKLRKVLEEDVYPHFPRR
ncbi:MULTISPECIES: hypothetical protein [Myxococcus]|uniref:hypothetical protein n=1 Tax=Myxococcus TaxID=32 RepID=UPI0002E37F4B|nr:MULTISPECIES: hypothetical protein [Myxococcus]NOJ58068.1 hypothetical protein [Myxococcus xanthus]QPM77889.1 hypothetical protein I5Q59_26865 [Myxococcus xanthus]QVW66956.1 hypothetical protein JTM82_32215 [Myxococcus xanthus DZ2]QZZ53086.1 hypothetical protein MyxoNM_28125 [Myxococcus xanthus]UEO06916.1 hypothetical protein K1515_10580 [Myxococcus xanthus DZ2]